MMAVNPRREAPVAWWTSCTVLGLLSSVSKTLCRMAASMTSGGANPKQTAGCARAQLVDGRICPCGGAPNINIVYNCKRNQSARTRFRAWRNGASVRASALRALCAVLGLLGADLLQFASGRTSYQLLRKRDMIVTPISC